MLLVLQDQEARKRPIVTVQSSVNNKRISAKTRNPRSCLRPEIFRLMIALSVQGQEIVAEQLDVVTAFLNAPVTENVYVVPPEGYDPNVKNLKLLRSLYVRSETSPIRLAPYVRSETSPIYDWHRVVNETLFNLGFKALKS